MIPLCHFKVSYSSDCRNVIILFPTTYWSWADFFGVERFQEFWISFQLQTLIRDSQVPHSILEHIQNKTTPLVTITKSIRLPITDFCFLSRRTCKTLGGTRECSYSCYPFSLVSVEKKIHSEQFAMPPSKPFTQMKDALLSQSSPLKETQRCSALTGNYSLLYSPCVCILIYLLIHDKFIWRTCE